MQLGFILLAGLVVTPAAAITGTTASDIQSTPFSTSLNVTDLPAALRSASTQPGLGSECKNDTVVICSLDHQATACVQATLLQLPPFFLRQLIRHRGTFLQQLTTFQRQLLQLTCLQQSKNRLSHRRFSTPCSMGTSNTSLQSLHLRFW